MNSLGDQAEKGGLDPTKLMNVFSTEISDMTGAPRDRRARRC